MKSLLSLSLRVVGRVMLKHRDRASEDGERGEVEAQKISPGALRLERLWFRLR